jgi:hypothetical protein
MKEEQWNLIQKLQPLQDEALEVLEGLDTVQSIITLAAQDTKAKLPV